MAGALTIKQTNIESAIAIASKLEGNLKLRSRHTGANLSTIGRAGMLI
ncbi:MAG: hypothetical protein HC903_11670 [Methylacidiphilales bacterium]|nr:hypothetical protein [Candidatus Methylacidiphilales bacterium]NJR16043.1 hypothetical protein [Calothrix sp. CSU_2_0]